MDSEVRDWIKDGEYFNHFFKEYDEVRIIFQEKLGQTNIAASKDKWIKDYLFKQSLMHVVARYSCGDGLKSIRSDFLSVAKEWESRRECLSYANDLWVVCLAVLLEVGEARLALMRGVLAEAGVEDWLLTFPLDKALGRDPSVEGVMRIPSRYGLLQQMAGESDPAQRESLMLEYLRYWYQRHQEEYWWGYDKDKHQPLYFGYWSFESGAFAKLLPIPDGRIGDRKYYPYDLVHYHHE
jgi:hypothetical protein